MKHLFALLLLAACLPAAAQDYEREQRWADQILPGLMIGDAVWLTQANGHKFLTLYTPAKTPRGAVIVAHGRGWSPDYELYGMIRVKLAERGYTTLSIQLPVLGGGAKIGDYIPTYSDAAERFDLAAKFLIGAGYLVDLLLALIGPDLRDRPVLTPEHIHHRDLDPEHLLQSVDDADKDPRLDWRGVSIDQILVGHGRP